MQQQRHLLIVGTGSVGKRHMMNFSALGCRVSVVDPRADRLAEAQAAARVEKAFTDLNQALDDGTKYDGIVICSPPSFHVAQAVSGLERGCPIFLEKPVSHSAESAEDLLEAVNRTGVRLLLGYTYRWWPALVELKARVLAGAVGRPLHVKCVMSAHLADWHPWERYQDFFMSSLTLGGGALLDESHFIDLMLWFFGRPTEVSGRVERLSTLDIETDDNVDALLAYRNGLRVYMHLDVFGRPHEKYITITGESGTLHWSFEPNRIRQAHTAEPQWSDVAFQGLRNDMFVAAAAEFLDVMTGKAEPSCTIEDGCEVLRVVEAIRKSSQSRTSVTVPDGRSTLRPDRRAFR